MKKISENTKKFMKDVGIAAIAGISAGVIATELSDLVTDSHGIISACSAIAEVTAETAAFAYLYYKDNRELYWVENRFQVKKYSSDMLKVIVGFRGLDYLYNGVVTPIINYSLQTLGVNHTLSFLIPNLAHLGYHIVTAIPLGKAFGLIKENKEYSESK